MAKSTVLAKVNAKSPRRKDRSLILTVKLTLYWAWIWRLYKRTKTVSLSLLCREGVWLFKTSSSYGDEVEKV